jgi:hypothetical protein
MTERHIGIVNQLIPPRYEMSQTKVIAARGKDMNLTQL